MTALIGLLGAVLVAASLPYWLPRLVVAFRVWLFARIGGPEGIPVPGDLVDASQFVGVYSHPAASGRGRGTALSNLFWYWLSPGAEMHPEYLEPGPQVDEVARCTRGILAVPGESAERLAADCVRAALPDRTGLVRLRDLVMPIWAEFYHRLLFDRPGTDDARRLIVDNAGDVITALECCGLRHMDRRLRLTAHLVRVLDRVPYQLPALLDRRERALYLQGTFFNTAVVQSADATAHLLMVLAADESMQRAAREDGALDDLFEETLRRFPLFGASHLVPITVKAVTKELLARFSFVTSASHTRPLVNRGPCLMTPRGAAVPLRTSTLVLLRLRDRWADVGRSLTQLVLGTYMVREAGRLRLCERYFETIEA